MYNYLHQGRILCDSLLVWFWQNNSKSYEQISMKISAGDMLNFGEKTLTFDLPKFIDK